MSATNLSLKFTSKFGNVPKQAGPMEVGYDLICVKESKRIGSRTIMYDTGISVCPPNGYYTEIVPRSSIIKTGYVLSNSTGIIDPTYRGTLRVCLTKIDDTLPDLELPFCLTQLIIRKMNHLSLTQVETLDETGRGDGGFGSTNPST
jgi:dUTP pyrophosphatase